MAILKRKVDQLDPNGDRPRYECIATSGFSCCARLTSCLYIDNYVATTEVVRFSLYFLQRYLVCTNASHHSAFPEYIPVASLQSPTHILTVCLPHFCPTGYVIFRQQDCHWPPCWSYHSLKWLPARRLLHRCHGNVPSATQSSVSATIRVS